ncbi:hypothetical protein YB2330_004062 [Saitoella coloradoensis]
MPPVRSRVTIPANGGRDTPVQKNPTEERGSATTQPISSKEVPPLDFTSLPLSTLRKYRHTYNLAFTPTTYPSALYGPLLNPSQNLNNAREYTMVKRSTTYHGSVKDELAGVVRKHFVAMPIKDNDVIVNFLYSVKNRDKTFKMKFPPETR